MGRGGASDDTEQRAGRPGLPLALLLLWGEAVA
jgi:hypothetical protein